MEEIIWVYRCFFSLVARAATLGNSWHLHKSKMATMDSRFASGWDIIQLIYLQSCVTPLYQIMFTRGIDFGDQFGDSRSIYRSNVKFNVIFGQGMKYNWSCTYVIDLENKLSTTKTSQHEPMTVLCKLFHLCSLDGDTSTVQQGPLHPRQLGGLHVVNIQ